VRFIGSDQANQAPTPESVLVGLDADQRAAVTAPVGIVVVRAGAGSGKTTVLTRRIAWRALNDTADIERTLAITFTRQAATEMRERARKLIGKGAQPESKLVVNLVIGLGNILNGFNNVSLHPSLLIAINLMG
jgi:ATP-dependent exoDNAse (exonuclease V) beta subunit